MVQVGDRIPDTTLRQMTVGGPADVTTAEIFGGKKVVLFGVTGAFTSTCSEQHLPGFVEKAEELTTNGAETIACVSVNDIDVMAAWAKDQKAGDSILMLADGSGVFAKALGLELDLVAVGMGVRSRRYSMVVDNGEVTHLNVEPGGECGVSSAGIVLAQL